jgi:diguanylate cyclase
LTLQTGERRTSTTAERQAPASTLAVRIVQAAVKPDVTASDLGALCQADPAFVVRLLSLVNSPAYGMSRRINDVQHAVSLLGTRGLRNLALSLAVQDMAAKGPDGNALLLLGVRRAVTAKLLAVAMGRKDPGEYFTIGLLMDAGLFMLARTDVKSAVASAKSPSYARPTVERSAGYDDHATTGAAMVREWNMAQDMVNAIARHHDDAPHGDPVGDVIWLTERCAGVFEGGDLAANRLRAIESAALLKLQAADVEKVLEQIPLEVTEGATAFNRDLGPQPDMDTLLRDANASLAEINLNYQEMLVKLERLLAEKAALANELAAANELLSKAAATDGLTGLANHRAFQEALKRDLARAEREKQPLSIVLIDADHFKKVNDTYGHPTGDHVLKTIASLMQEVIRTGDLAARYGGEEFIMVLPNANADGAKIVAERLRKTIEATAMQGPNGPFKVTASFGVACTQGPGCGKRGPELIETADKALYEAKHAGRNQVVTRAA